MASGFTPARPGARLDMSTPANQRKLDVVEELALLAEPGPHPRRSKPKREDLTYLTREADSTVPAGLAEP
jgi:hypothetical protein